MATLTPVEGNPFEVAAPAAGPRLTPVEGNPFQRNFNIDWTQPIPAVRAAIGGLPEADRPEALRQWADAYVAAERAPIRQRRQRADEAVARGDTEGGLLIEPTAIGDAARMAARGTIAGPWLDELNAGTNALLSRITGGRAGAPHDETVAYQRALDRAMDEEYGWAGTGAQVVGGLAGGGAAYNAARRLGLPALTATTVPRQMAIGSGVGAAAAANYAAGTSEGTPEERLAAATDPGTLAIGATVGAAIPPAIGAGNALLQSAHRFASPTVARVAANIRDIPRRIGIHASADGGVPTSPGAMAAAEQMTANQAVRAGMQPDDFRDAVAAAERSSLYHGGGERGASGASYAQNALMTVDIDPSLQRLAGSMTRASPEAANIAAARMRARQTGLTPGTEAEQRMLGGSGLPTRESMSRPDPSSVAGQGERLVDALRRAQTISDRVWHRHMVTGRGTVDQIVDTAERDARRHYAIANSAARRGRVDIARHTEPTLAGWEARLVNESDDMQRELGRLIETFRNSRSLERFDRNKRQLLDDAIDKAIQSGDNYRAMRLTRFKDDLLAAVDGITERNVGGLYAGARAQFSSKMEMRDSYNLGKRLFQDNSDVGVAQVQAHSQPGMEGRLAILKLGTVDSARDAMERMRSGADRLAVFDTPRVRNILSYLIPRTETATGRVRVRGGEEAVFGDRPQRFGRFIENEQRMIATRNEVVGNSKTAQRLADDDAYRSLNTVTEVFQATGSPTAALLKVGERALQRVFGMRQDAAVAGTRMLFSADPLQRRQFIESVIQRMGANRAEQLARYLQQHQAMLTAGAGRGAGAATTQEPARGR